MSISSKYKHRRAEEKVFKTGRSWSCTERGRIRFLENAFALLLVIHVMACLPSESSGSVYRYLRRLLPFFSTRLLQRHQQHRRSFTTNHSDYANEKCVCHGPTPIYYLIMTVVCELLLMLGNYLCIRHNLCYIISSLPNYQHAACPNSEQRGCLVCRGSKWFGIGFSITRAVFQKGLAWRRRHAVMAWLQN
jgi:hypothetical protein